MQSTTRLSTLLDLRYQKHYEAENGEPRGRQQLPWASRRRRAYSCPSRHHGLHDTTQELLADLTVDGESCIIATGGHGGRGNTRFATSTNRVPTRFEPGTPGEERFLRLDLKLLADVGLVGYPNAGKSTLIAAVSAARPKIADYPFTTLTPNLAVVRWNESQTFVIADIPGLIEGAHEGRGLGFRVLRHIKRPPTDPRDRYFRVWISGRLPFTSFEVMRHELTAYDESLAARPFAVLGTKLDVKGQGERLERLGKYANDARFHFLQFRRLRERDWTTVCVIWAGVELLRKTPCETNS